MKIIPALLTVVGMSLVMSCSKNNDEPNPIDNSKLHELRFTVSGFNESHIPMDSKAATSSSTAASPINNILYVLLDKDLLPIDTLMRPVKGSASSLSLKLPNGDYTLRAVGFDNSNTHSLYTKYQLVFTRFIEKEIFKIKDYDISDVFILNKSFKVSKDSTYSKLALKRITSKIELNILDKIPTEASYIEIATNSSSNFFTLSKDLKDNITYPYNTDFVSNVIDISSLRTLANQIISSNILTDDQKFTEQFERTSPVKINVLDSTGKVILGKEILNVRLLPNTITRLSGKLFEDINKDKNESFAVTIDQNFNSNVITQTF